MNNSYRIYWPRGIFKSSTFDPLFIMHSNENIFIYALKHEIYLFGRKPNVDSTTLTFCCNLATQVTLEVLLKYDWSTTEVRLKYDWSTTEVLLKYGHCISWSSNHFLQWDGLHPASSKCLPKIPFTITRLLFLQVGVWCKFDVNLLYFVSLFFLFLKYNWNT